MTPFNNLSSTLKDVARQSMRRSWSHDGDEEVNGHLCEVRPLRLIPPGLD